jgi:hypothetical protein
MAGDWIAMEKDLWDSPKVVRILSAICPQDVRTVSARVRFKSQVIGALFRLWSLFDTHSDDGVMHGYDAETINEAVGIDNFAENLQHVGWLILNADSVEMPGFSKHLGQSAKRRLKDAERKRESRKASASCPQNVRKNSDRMRTTEQNRTEEKSTSTKVDVSVLFNAWYESYPRKIGRDQAARAYPKALAIIGGPVVAAAASLLAASRPRLAKLAERDPQYIPHPATWLNSRGWEDDVNSISPAPKPKFGPGQTYQPQAAFGDGF